MADLRASAQRAPSGEGDDRRHGDGHQGVGGRAGQGLGVGAGDQVAQAPLNHLGDAGLLVGLAGLDLDDLDAVQAFHDGGGQGRGFVHGQAGRVARAVDEVAHHHRDDGRDDQQQQGQHRVLDHHHHARGEGGEQVLGIVDQARGRRLADQAGVIEHRGDIGAGMGRAQPLQVRADEVAEQLHLDVGDHLVADAVGQHRLDQLGGAARHADGGDAERDIDQGPGVLVQEQQPHRRLQTPGQHPGQSADHRRAEHGGGEAGQMRPQIGAEHARHQPAAVFGCGGRKGGRHRRLASRDRCPGS